MHEEAAFKEDMMSGMFEGEPTMGMPVISVAAYLAYPRHARWPIYLGYAMMKEMCFALLDGEKDVILNLIGVEKA